MGEIFRGGRVQFGVRKTIVGHKRFISYQYVWFPGVNGRISNSFPSLKADFYDVISLKIEQLFTYNFALFIVLCQ